MQFDQLPDIINRIRRHSEALEAETDGGKAWQRTHPINEGEQERRGAAMQPGTALHSVK